MLKQTPKKRVLFVRRSSPVALVVFGVLSLLVVNIHTPKMAYAASANTVNFQARLQTASGAIVPDGNYNVQFKIYSASSGGTALWTEDYLNANSQGLQTINGYLSANLGSINAFSGINWDQQLWLTMNIGGTVTTGTFPSIGDGEMNPRLSLTAVPAAFSAQQLASTNGSNRSTLTLQGSSNGNQDFVIQDQGAAGTYDLLTQNQADATYMQNTASPQTATFNISGAGTADTLQGNTAVITPSILAKTDSTSGIQFDNSTGDITVMTIDTVNSRVGIGTDTPSATLDIKGAGSDYSTVALNVQNSTGGTLLSLSDDGSFTVGSTAASGTSATIGISDTTGTTPDGGGDSNYFAATKVSTGATGGALTSLSIYINSIDPNPAYDKYRLAIYADGGADKPTTLIAQSAEGTLVANSYNTLPVSASLAANTTYWVAFVSNGAAVGSSSFSYRSAAAGTYYAYSYPYAALPSTASTGGSNGAIAVVMYGTYAESGTGTVPALTVAASGNIGIGVGSPIYALQVQGTAYASAYLQNGNTVCDISNNCGALTSGTGVTLQTGTPSAQTGSLDITGAAIAGSLQAASLDRTTSGTLSIGTSTATSISIGSSASATTINGSVTVGGAATFGTLALGNFSGGGSIGSAATTVDLYSSISVNQTSSSQTLTIPSPTASTAYGKLLYLSNIGTQGFTLLSTLLKPGATATLIWSNTNGGASWQYAGSDGNSILNQSSSTQTADFKISGTGTASMFTASTLSAPNSLSIQAGSGNNDVNILAAGTGTVKLETGSAGGSITLGSSNLTRTINIGSTGSQAQTITVGDNTSASGSATTIQGSDGVTLQTNKSTAGVTVKSVTNSATAFQIQNATNTNLVNVDTVGGNVNLGIGTPPSPLGYTKVGGNAGSAYNNTINANQFTATQTGAVSTMSVYVSSPDSSPTNHFQVAVYTNSGGVPSAYVASSASTTLTSGWNTVSLTSAPTLNAGTSYWLVYWADVNDGSNSGMSSDSGIAGSVYYYATSTYGSGASNGMPTTFPSGTNAGTIAHSIYVTFASTSYAATISGSGSLSVTGAATFTDNSNSTTAFQIQNSSGTSVLTADTINNRISIGTIGTSTSQLYVAGTVPTLVGVNSDSNMTDPRNMTVVGHYAYVIDRSANKINAYNLVTGTPVYVGKNSDANLSTPFAVAGAGHYVYVVNNVSNKLTSYDISSGTPVYVGQNSDSNLSNPQSVAISGRYAYVTSYTTHKVVAYDISSGTPVYVGQNSDSNLTGPSYIATGTGYVYVVDSSTNKLLTYNISTGIPVYAGINSDSTISTAEALTVNGNYAYIPNDGASNKLLVYDITTSTPTFVGQNSDANLSTPYDVAISGRYAYVLSKANNKLVAYDISSGTPVYIGSNSDSTLSSPIAVSLYGSYIFVTSNTTHKLVSYSLGGAYLQQLQTGSADLGSLSVDGNTTMMGNATVQGGVSIGQSLQVNGSTGIQGALGVGGTITSNALNVGSTGQFVVDSSGNFTTTGGTTTVKTTSTTALSVQNASNVSYFNVDTSTGTITIGNAASGNYITFTAAGGLIASGTAQHAKTISLSAEYAGAVLDATQDSTCTSSNNGAMTSAYDGTNNYYKWVSNATAQCYDVVVRVPIPSDWSSWSSTTPVTVNAYTTNTSTSLVNLQVLNSASNTAEASCSYANITPGSTSTWSTANSSNCVFASTTTGYAAGGTMTLRIRMTGSASSDVRIDGITLNYNSKF